MKTTVEQLMLELRNIMHLMTVWKREGTTYDEARYLIVNNQKCSMGHATGIVECFESISGIKLER